MTDNQLKEKVIEITNKFRDVLLAETVDKDSKNRMDEIAMGVIVTFSSHILRSLLRAQEISISDDGCSIMMDTIAKTFYEVLDTELIQHHVESN